MHANFKAASGFKNLCVDLDDLADYLLIQLTNFTICKGSLHLFREMCY